MAPAAQVLLWADRLRDLSALGLRFADNIYDKERYRAIQDIAMEMLALATDEPLERLEPLRAPVLSRPTPFVGGDAAVIDDAGRILLIRRADNEKWAMPGGALEVGETPAQGVVREVLEETGVPCEAVALVGVFDSRLCDLPTRHHLYLLTFLCRPIKGAQVIPPSHAIEVLDVRWFQQDSLPDDLGPGTASRLPAILNFWRDQACAFFDR